MTDNKKQEQKNEVRMEDFFFNPWKLLKLDVQNRKSALLLTNIEISVSLSPI